MVKVTKSSDNESVEDKENLLQALKVEAKKNEGKAKDGKSQDEVFNKILEKITKIGFRKLAGKEYTDDIKKPLLSKHFIVPIAKETLKISKEVGFQLAKHNSIIYLFNGCYWVAISQDKLSAFLGECSIKMGVTPNESDFFRFRENLVSQFYSSAYFENPEISKDNVLINLRNGTFEVSGHGQILRAFNPEDFMRYQLPFSYDTKATAPLFEKYLDRVLPDKDLQNLLSEYLGYVFIKNLKLEKVLLLFGGGGNGKSVIFEIINKLFGSENITNYPLDSLNEPQNRAELEGKLLNYASELKDGIDSDTFKQLASGEPIFTRRLYQSPYVMTDYAKLMFNANKLPKDVEHNEAYFRRFIIIPFTETITAEEKDVQLHNKIINNELSGVFNWVLLGLNRVILNKGFTVSKISTNFLEAYKNESDTVAMFLDENGYEKNFDGKYTSASELYSSYKEYSKTYCYSPLNFKNFKARLESRKITVYKKDIGLVVNVVKVPLIIDKNS
jgi:putative DNA primase/helicase